MIRFVILFALASALGAPILAAPARADAKADLAAAIKAEESKTYDKALRLYGRALAAKDLDEEGRARAHFGRANILIHIKRRWTTAIRELDALIRLRPDYRGALRMRAKAYRKRAYDTLSTKDLDRSLADLERISRKSIQLNFKPPICAFLCLLQPGLRARPHRLPPGLRRREPQGRLRSGRRLSPPGLSEMLGILPQKRRRLRHVVLELPTQASPQVRGAVSVALVWGYPRTKV